MIAFFLERSDGNSSFEAVQAVSLPEVDEATGFKSVSCRVCQVN